MAATVPKMRVRSSMFTSKYPLELCNFDQLQAILLLGASGASHSFASGLLPERTFAYNSDDIIG